MLQLFRIVLFLLLVALPLRAQELELRFLDVGQGDAILIREGGKTALVDAGPSAARIMPYLAALKVDTIDLLVATHNHADHIGGMPAVLSGASVRYYLDNALPYTTGIYQRTIAAVQRSGAQYLRPTGRSIALGTAQIRVLSPPTSRDQNNASVGLVVQYGEFRAFLMGDAEVREIRYWLSREPLPRMQVAKVAHHGSRNGTIPELVAATRPEVAVISVGATNAYGHPSPEVLDLWTRAGARIHRTDLEGTILILARRDGSFREGAEQFAGATAIGPQILRPDIAGAPSHPLAGCCKVCSAGKACGNSCISRSYTCHRPPGCACDASP
ncbi:MAG: MBL fold metallo-hydrolase [Deltaproteobacteria bacterium]|nr:MAG: MBL fold metallo-hydrolase [Deltaproteobacteria bacterium]